MPIRVLQLCAVDFTVAKFLLPLVEFLEARGCEVTVACTPGEDWPGLKERGLRLMPVRIERSANLWAHRRAAHALLPALRRSRFDVVHVHTPVASLIGRWAAAKAQVPVILYTAHGFYFHGAMRPWLRRLHVALERWGARRHHHLFTQSEEDRRTAIAEGIATPATVTTIGNGVDIARFDPWLHSAEKLSRLREELRLPPETPVVLTIARLVREKGLGEFLEAAALVRERLPEARFVVAGSALASDRGDFAGEIQRLIAERGLREAVVFAGLRGDIPALMALSSVYCLPSWREGMPRSIIEAMATARPVVATDIRGCREEVVPGETGYLVPVRDPRTLADRLLRLLMDSALARRMGDAGRLRATEMFDERLVLERQWRVYQALLRQRGEG
jgi:glycosyltransferase involved in cell wall biosynthesis